MVHVPTPQELAAAAAQAAAEAEAAAEAAAAAAAAEAARIRQEILNAISILESQYTYLNSAYTQVRQEKAEIITDINTAINLANSIKSQLQTYTKTSNLGVRDCVRALDDLVADLEYMKLALAFT